MELLLEFWAALRAGMRVSDILDILIVAACIYAVLPWVLTRTSRAVVVGLALVAALYVVAGQLEMVLTLWLFQVGFTALLIGLILVFQTDLRRGFEHLAAAVGIIDPRRRLSDDRVEILAQALSNLAERRIGALVVLPGREPLEPYVTGGTELDGRLSAPLIDSIFDPSSKGHDGAVVIEGDRVLRFGVHLPLSEDLEQLGDRGTRHAAGLGLSERVDALVLIVSEETGTLSTARRGALSAAKADADLRAQIEAFARESGPQASEQRLLRRLITRHLRPALTHRWPSKLLAATLALALWLAVSFRYEPVVRQFSVPVQFTNLPTHMAVTDVHPEAVTVTLSGPPSRFSLIRIDDLRLSIDLSDGHPGRHLVTIDESHIDLPAGGLRVSDFSPDGVGYTLALNLDEEPPG